MKSSHIPAKGRTPEEVLVWLINYVIEMEKRIMATFDDINTKQLQADAQAKDRAAELAKAKADLVTANQTIADLQAAAAAAPTSVITADQATTLDTTAAALVTDTAPVA